MGDKLKLIGIKESTKTILDSKKIISRETYDSVIKRELHKTNIEIIMKETLKKSNFEFVEQYPIRCKYGYIVDFFIPKYKLIIECDGEIWHPEGNSRDKKRDGFLKSKGYNILRFKGQKIINTLNTELIDEITKFIKLIQLEGGKKSNGKS